MFVPHKKGKVYHIPVTIEIGSFSTRAGYAGNDQPDLILPSDYLVKDGEVEWLEFQQMKIPAGGEIQNLMHKDQIIDYDVFKKRIEHICFNKLKMDKHSPLFLVEQSINKKDTRQKIIEMIFEDIGFDSVYMHRGHSLGAYIFGKENLLLLDCGANQTTVLPIIEGMAQDKALVKQDFGGELLTNYLYEKWKSQKQVFSRYRNYEELTPSQQKWGNLEVIREIKHSNCKFYESGIQNLKFNEAVDNSLVELPDKEKIELSREIYQIPELMFQNDLGFTPVDKMIEQSLEKLELDTRRELVQSIMVIGGNSMTSNFLERLQKQIFDLKLGGLQTKGRVFSTPNFYERGYANWLGGSVMGSMSNFDQYLVSKQDYQENGATLIDRKFFH